MGRHLKISSSQKERIWKYLPPSLIAPWKSSGIETLPCAKAGGCPLRRKYFFCQYESSLTSAYAHFPLPSLCGTHEEGAFILFEAVIMSPAALSSPGRGDITASVFLHSIGSVSFDHFQGPLLDPFETAHNLWNAWPGTLGLAWLELSGMTMSLFLPLTILQMPAKTDLSLLLQQHKAGSHVTRTT